MAGTAAEFNHHVQVHTEMQVHNQVTHWLKHEVQVHNQVAHQCKL